MGALLENFSVLDNDDVICFHDSGKTMGDNKGGTTNRQFSKGLLNMRFCFSIDTACGLVQ
jgi:hypothetical protein